MSQENAELVQALVMAFINEGDLVALWRDERRLARLFTPWAPRFHEHFETVVRGWPAGENSYPGVLAQRSFWADWLAPWVEYRQELWKTIDLGDRALLLFHEFGRRKDMTQEIRGETAAIWTIRDSRFTRAEFFLSQGEALKAAGLEGKAP
jgi:ketosteroid isomerase-like protein